MPVVKRRVIKLTYRNPLNQDGVGKKTCYGDDEARAFAADREVISAVVHTETRLNGRELDLYLLQNANDALNQEDVVADPRVPGARLAKWHQHSSYGGRCGGTWSYDGNGCGEWFKINDPVGLVFYPDREHGVWHHLACAERLTGQVADTSWPHDATLH